MLTRTTLDKLILLEVLKPYLEKDEENENYGQYHITVEKGYDIKTLEGETIDHFEGWNKELWIFNDEGEVNHPLQNNLGMDDEIEVDIIKK